MSTLALAGSAARDAPEAVANDTASAAGVLRMIVRDALVEDGVLAATTMAPPTALTTATPAKGKTKR